MYDVELVNILREDQMEQLEQQNIVLNYHVRLAKLPSELLIYETQEVRINQSLAEKNLFRQLGENFETTLRQHGTTSELNDY